MEAVSCDEDTQKTESRYTEPAVSLSYVMSYGIINYTQSLPCSLRLI